MSRWPRMAASEGSALESWVMGFLGITRIWTGPWGWRSWKATQTSSSWISFTGISLRVILPKMVSSAWAGGATPTSMCGSFLSASDIFDLVLIDKELRGWEARDSEGKRFMASGTLWRRRVCVAVLWKVAVCTLLMTLVCLQATRNAVRMRPNVSHCSTSRQQNRGRQVEQFKRGHVTVAEKDPQQSISNS